VASAQEIVDPALSGAGEALSIDACADPIRPRRGFPRRAALMTVHFAMMRRCDAIEDPAARDETRAAMLAFLEAVGKSVGIERGTVPYMLHVKFIKTSSGKKIPTQAQTAELLIRGWNAVRTGKGGTSLQTHGGQLPEIEV
jgi:hypothetical protein